MQKISTDKWRTEFQVTNTHVYMNHAGVAPLSRRVSEAMTAFDENTRVVTISHVEFASGFRNDIKAIGEICHERDIWFVVDAIQSLGAINVDVQSACVDILTADGHKWLLAPEGAAIFYCANDKLERIIRNCRR